MNDPMPRWASLPLSVGGGRCVDAEAGPDARAIAIAAHASPREPAVLTAKAKVPLAAHMAALLCADP